MKSKAAIIYDALNSDTFHAWFCGEFTEHSILPKAKREAARADMEVMITRHFRKLFVQTPEEQAVTETKPAAETKTKPAKKRTEPRVNVTITGAPEPVKVEKGTSAAPEAFEAKPNGEVSAIDSHN